MNAATIIALHMLNGGCFDFNAIGIALFEKNPDLFLELSKIQKTGPLWMHEVIHYLRANRDVEAIKTIRTHTGAGLYESKQVIDWVSDRHTEMRPLDEDQLKVANQIKNMM